MERVFRTLATTVKDAVDEFWILVICNLLWAFFSLPLLGLALLALVANNPWLAALIGGLSVVLIGPATAGLYTVAQRVVDGRTSKIGHFFTGMRRYALTSWRVLGIWTVGLFIILFDLNFYGNLDTRFGIAMIVFWIYLLVIWCAFLIYLFPLLLLQAKPGLRILARNTFIMVLGHPGFTFVTFLLMALVVALSIIPIFPLFFTAAFLAVWSLRAAHELIRDSEERRTAIRHVDEPRRRGQIHPH